jgi:small subunit ribosomal protein S6
MFLLDSNRYARDPGGVSGQITQIVEKCGGEILATRLWNEQKLAYTIEGHRKGTYWLMYFRMDSAKQGDLTRACRLNENILRNLVIRIDDRLVDTLVRHATVSGSVPSAEAADSARTDKATETVTETAAPPDQQAEQEKTEES